MQALYKKILQKLNQSQNILILTHPNPDGDALGSSVGLYHILKSWGKNAQLLFSGHIEPRIQFLIEEIKYATSPQNLPKNFDCVLVLDIGDHSRIEHTLQHLSYQLLINIDHHPSNQGFAHLNLVDPQASSTGEILCLLFEHNYTILPLKAAYAFYTAIVSDTGFFSFSNATAKSLATASRLVATGIDTEAIVRHLQRSKPLALFKLEAEYLQQIQFSPHHKIAWGKITEQMCQKYGVNLSEIGGFVEIPRCIQGVEISILFKPSDEDGISKVSLRSNDPQLDVNAFASQFHGGGHTRAAGCTLPYDLKTTEQIIVKHIQEFFQKQKGFPP
ncbi:MAG: bifunctional oligoribonuclease/PAP phosphatase NrnA [Planctomycetota bacterium]|nr:MAG: bifunctional oligoribonuclease/PAP phosphatase NrnA [Planctomycetota bacterium]